MQAFKVVYADLPVWMLFFVFKISRSYLFEVHHDATFLHHGVLLVVIHQVGQGVKPLTAAHVVFTVLLETNINNSIYSNSWSDELPECKNES